jgi:alkaline phosphatase D
MTPPPVSRRSVLQGLAVGAVATVAPVRWFDAEAAAAPAARGVFGYGVASGDPTPQSVILWTRATPSPDATPGSGLGAPVAVRWEVARDREFEHVVAAGNARTSAASDHTVKIDAGGLEPYTRYWYRFRARGETSPVGRTQTAPDRDGRDHALRLAFVSCSNYTGGYFTAYRGIARRDDLDFVLHLGDYLYEYGEGPAAPDRYGPKALAGVRDGVPDHEILSLADYRLRHALHKGDPDLAAAHARFPWITTLDDHEVANNQWATGAENHQANEGDFAARRAVAYQAYLEWMPIRPAPVPDPVPHQGQVRWFRRFTYGSLADLTVLETRQNRSEQIETPGSTSKGGGFVPAALPGFADPSRHLPEPEQLSFLLDNMGDRRFAWHLVGNNVVFSRTNIPGAVLGAPVDLLNSDAWDGYQADQSAVVARAGSLPAAAGDTVFMTGDIHSSWVFDVPADPSTYVAGRRSVAVEFVGPSVTSDGFKEVLGGTAQAQAAAAAVSAANPWIRKLDAVGHGYCVLDVTRERVQCDWWFLSSPLDDPRLDPQAGTAHAFSYRTAAGARRAVAVAGPVGKRSDRPRGDR